jgi:glycosyltransferase involved in cell wall biosynthesis
MSYLVSVIITAYNQEDFIEQAIDSVLEQNHKEFECIISDDGSDDSTLEICKTKYSKYEQIRIITQKNAGPGSARNHGFRNISDNSRYIVFLDGDDCLAPSFLAELSNYLEQKPDVGLVTCQFQKIDEYKKTQGNGYRSRYVSGFLGIPRKLKQNEIDTPFVSFFSATGQGPFAMFRKSVFELTDLWEENFWPHEDTDIFCQMALKSKVHALPHRLYLKREHQRNILNYCPQKNTYSFNAFKKNSYELFRKKWDLWKGTNISEKEVIKKAKSYYYYSHKPFRNLNLILGTLKRTFPRYDTSVRWWIWKLLKDAFDSMRKHR